jgi:hypothetical protein
VLVPGKLGTVNISLFPFSTHILGLLDDSFAAMQMDYEIIGLHWRGGENDITDSNAYLKENLMDIYRRIFGEFNRILKHPPIVLHEIYCPERMHDLDPTGAYLENMFFINDTFHALANEFDNISLFDVRRAPFYVADERQHGIFIGDAIHCGRNFYTQKFRKNFFAVFNITNDEADLRKGGCAKNACHNHTS